MNQKEFRISILKWDELNLAVKNIASYKKNCFCILTRND
jgi:hypothetical protein